MTKKLIYVIDDEKDIREILKLNLESEGYEVHSVQSADTALADIPKKFPDLILLDIMMEGTDGYEFCRKLRSSDSYRHIPIIFLSAKSEEFDKVLGLELGGDDYMTKPFSIKELKSRVKAVLRRSERGESGPASGTLKFEGIELDPEGYEVLVDGKRIELTKTEFDILHLLIKSPGKIFTRDNIINSIMGHDVYVVDRTIDVHVMNLRKKLGKYKNAIKTFSGVGYGLRK